ncbi:hypothetical protein FI667_g2583, partial [Globisporangium splendens]
MKLFCVIVGVVGDVFSLDVAPTATVDDVKKAIKKENQHVLARVDAHQLQLFLARRTEDGSEQWLASKSDDMAALKAGNSSTVRDLLQDELDPTEQLEDVISFPLPKRTIHLLVTVPTKTTAKTPKKPAAPTRTLNCVIVGKKSIFSVKLPQTDPIFQLRRRIKATAESDLKGFSADKLKLFLAKRNGEWISATPDTLLGNSDVFEDLLLQDELDSSSLVEDVFTQESSAQKTIQVIVYTLNIPKSKIHHSIRLKRWRKLNERFSQNKRVKFKVKSDDDEPLTAYSDVKLSQVESIFDTVQKYTQAELAIPDDRMERFHKYLCETNAAFGDYMNGREAKRVHFIAPFLVCVCSLLNSDESEDTPKTKATLHAEEDVVGNRVNATGHFEFVIARGKKKICIVEVKKELFDKGTAQSLTGCEAVADVYDLNVVYSIVTNYEVWHFIKSEDQCIRRDIVRMEEDADCVPTYAFMKKVAQKIHSVLVGYNEENEAEKAKSLAAIAASV